MPDEATSQSPAVAELLKQLSADELSELKKALGVKKGRAPKEQTPEYLEAKAELDAVIAENPEFVTKYENAKEKLRGVKGTRVVHATKRYDFDLESGEIVDRETKDVVGVFGNDGWQKGMRDAGFTAGQVAAVSKSVRTASKKEEAA